MRISSHDFVQQFCQAKCHALHRATESLLLGIDHTVIAVVESDGRVRFCRDILGLCVVGDGEAIGPGKST